MVGLIDVTNPSHASEMDLKALLTESRKLAESGRAIEALAVLDKAENKIRHSSEMDEIERDLILSRICNNRGITFKNMKAWDKSAECYEKALTHLERTKKNAVRERIGIEINLAILRTRQKERKRALEGFDRAEKLAASLGGKEKDELTTKILTNRAQLHLEFNEIQLARELIDRISTCCDRKNPQNRKEHNARVSAQLAQLIAQVASEMEESERNEMLLNAVKFFDEARILYEEIGLKNDALTQGINVAEVLAQLKRFNEANNELENILNEAKAQDNIAIASTAINQLIETALRTNNYEKCKSKIHEAIKIANALPELARKEFIETLEAKMRLSGNDELLAMISQFHEGHGLN